MLQNIILTGFMGTGKTTVGRILAAKLGRPFLDVDELIVEMEGKEIPTIFSESGEEYFRQLETRAISQAISGEAKVISTGGGALLTPKNREMMQAGGFLLCFTASPTEIINRLGQGKGRPLLQGENALSKVRELLKERSPLYAEVLHKISTDGKKPQKIVQEILLLLQEEGVI